MFNIFGWNASWPYSISNYLRNWMERQQPFSLQSWRLTFGSQCIEILRIWQNQSESGDVSTKADKSKNSWDWSMAHKVLTLFVLITLIDDWRKQSLRCCDTAITHTVHSVVSEVLACEFVLNDGGPHYRWDKAVTVASKDWCQRVWQATARDNHWHCIEWCFTISPIIVWCLRHDHAHDIPWLFWWIFRCCVKCVTVRDADEIWKC